MSLADNFTPALDTGTMGYQVLFSTMGAMSAQDMRGTPANWTFGLADASPAGDSLYDFQVNVLSGYVAKGAILDQIA